MAHTHSHEEDRNYYIDQLCTIGVAAALGAVCIVMYWKGALGLLADAFHLAVLLGGVALLLVAGLRAVTLWASFSRAGGAMHVHEHDHEHGHGHHHEHGEACEHHHHHDHEHAHHHEHGHQHHEHGHSHAHDDHGHSHGWNPIKYVFLLLPIVLFMVRMPSADFNDRFRDFLTRLEAGRLGNADYEMKQVGKAVDTLGMQIDRPTPDEPLRVVGVVGDDSGSKAGVKTTEGAAKKAGVKKNDVIVTIADLGDDKPEVLQAQALTLDEAAQALRGKPRTAVRLTLQREGEPEPVQVEMTREVVIQNLGFKELDKAALSAFTRQAYEGMTVRLRGQYVPRMEKAFSLIRVKINCCAADAVPINVVIALDPQSKETVTDLQSMQWIEVTGQVTFHKRKDREEYVPVLQVASRAEGIRPTAPEAFLQ